MKFTSCFLHKKGLTLDFFQHIHTYSFFYSRLIRVTRSGFKLEKREGKNPVIQGGKFVIPQKLMMFSTLLKIVRIGSGSLGHLRALGSIDLPSVTSTLNQVVSSKALCNSIYREIRNLRNKTADSVSDIRNFSPKKNERALPRLL